MKLSPYQQAILADAVTAAAKAEEDAARAQNHAQALIQILMGKNGEYRVITDQGPWEIVEQKPPPVRGSDEEP